MFGAILGATDPVAATQVLHSFGLPKWLSSLLDAESLLNDGTAFVLFLMFKDYATDEESRDAGDVVLFFMRLSAGAVILGAVFGVAIVVWLQYIKGDTDIETVILIISGYSVFVIADGAIDVSAVLGVVTLGIVISRFKISHVAPIKLPFALRTLELLALVHSTLLFDLSGANVGEELFFNDTVRGVDVAFLLTLYVVLHILRAFMVFVCYYPLKHVSDAAFHSHARVDFDNVICFSLCCSAFCNCVLQTKSKTKNNRRKHCCITAWLRHGQIIRDNRCVQRFARCSQSRARFVRQQRGIFERVCSRAHPVSR
jgi:NhaP-type Na+/H+ or K+/H+ antiporter